MHESSINAQKGKPQDNDFKKYMKKDIPAAFWGVNSELIFAGLCNDAGYSVKFDTPDSQHDYDFIVNEIPCQVKTILSTEKNIEEYTMKVNNMIAELRAGKKINEEEVKKEILNLLHENREDIKKAMQQGGRIICVNGTHTYAGFLLNQLASDNKIDFVIQGTLQKSINLLHEENTIGLLKVIFGAAAIDINYRFSTMGFKIPLSLTLEGSKLSQIDKL
jgi:hypothetical protein